MALQNREAARSGEPPMATRLPGAETGEPTTTAVMWLELAEGPMREALAERLAQAHMRGVLPEDPIETPHGTVKKP